MVDVIPSSAALLPKFTFSLKKLVFSSKLLIAIFSFVGFNYMSIFGHFCTNKLVSSFMDDAGICVANGPSTLGKASTFSSFTESILLK